MKRQELSKTVGILILVSSIGTNLVRSWEFEVIDSSFSNSSPSLAIDRLDVPHVVYSHSIQPEANSKTRYAYKNDNNWIIQDIDTLSYPGELVLDSIDHPHISYQALGYPINYLKYAHFDDGLWYKELVDTIIGVSRSSSLDLDSQDRPHISYYTSNYNLDYTYYNGYSWIFDGIASGEAGWSNSIAVDSEDSPHIAFSDYSEPTGKYILMYGYDREIGGWLNEVADSSGPYIGYYCSIALDTNYEPHISYTEAKESFEDNDLKYAQKTGFEWETATVDSVGDVGWYTSLVLDDENRPHISYSGSYSVKYAHWDGDSWNVEVVANIAERKSYSSIALDSREAPIIVFYQNSDLDPEKKFLTLASKSPTSMDNSGSLTNQFPKITSLGQNYPNPFNPSTTIPFTVSLGTRKHVQIAIYDIRGRKIISLINEEKFPGQYQIVWNGKDASGNEVNSGLYLCVLKLEGKVEGVRKTLLLK